MGEVNDTHGFEKVLYMKSNPCAYPVSSSSKSTLPYRSGRNVAPWPDRGRVGGGYFPCPV